MSVLFPKTNKLPEWDYRPIYYDKEKEARKDKLARLHRGSFREQHEKSRANVSAARGGRLAFWIALLAMLLFCFYYIL